MEYGTPYVRKTAPYVGGKPISELAREIGMPESSIIKLASNENPLGYSPRVKTVLENALTDIARYPDSNGHDLKQALSQFLEVSPDWITLGNGSNDLLELLARAMVAPGQTVVFSRYAFAVYAIATQAVGGHAVVVPDRNFGHDLSAMAKAVRDHNSPLVFIANPNNPTGTYLQANEIEEFLTEVPAQTVVVLDQAYDEYIQEHMRYDALKWLRSYPNLVICRTFSKAYGLAGLRVGYGVAHPAITDLLNRIRQPFNVNQLAQMAAIAALQDTEFIRQSYNVNREGYQQLTAFFTARQVPYIESQANFVLFKAGEESNAGQELNQQLLQRGVIVRPVDGYGLPQWLRVTIGTPAENQKFIDTLSTVH